MYIIKFSVQGQAQLKSSQVIKTTKNGSHGHEIMKQCFLFKLLLPWGLAFQLVSMFIEIF